MEESEIRFRRYKLIFNKFNFRILHLHVSYNDTYFPRLICPSMVLICMA